MMLRGRHILLVLLLTVLPVAMAGAQVSGFAEWNYADYQRDAADGRDIDGSSFSQTYSVLYNTGSLLNGGRAGEWRAALGYQWSSLDSSLNDADQSLSEGKILYSGDLLFAPGGLPLRLHVFSHDMVTSQPISDLRPTFVESTIDTSLIGAGENRVTGITFWGGIKNGSYLGNYREILSQFPKLLIDYREVVHSNDEGFNKEDTRLRDLAFISLNKKDNWFHYRVTEYEDYVDPENNFENREYLLGTIDHNYTREWINLTNWIKLSVDGSLTQESYANGERDDIYSLNLFTKFNRKSWQLVNFNNIERSLDEKDQLSKELRIPIFATGQYDAANRWRMSLVHFSEEESAPGVSVWNKHNFFTTYQLESARQSGHIQTATVALDVIRGSSTDQGQSVRVGVERFSDVRRGLDTDWLASYSLGWYNNGETSDSYFEQQFVVSADHRPNARVRLGGKQNLVVGFGESRGIVTENLQPIIGNVEFNTEGSLDDSRYNLSGTSWLSETGLYLELLENRWNNRFSADLRYLDRLDGRTTQLGLGHILNYAGARATVSVETSLEMGDDVSCDFDGTNVRSLRSYTGEADRSFRSEAEVTYSPLRSWSTTLGGAVGWAEGVDGSAGVAEIYQSSSYALFSSTGLRRQLMKFEQTALYARNWGVDSVKDLDDGTPWYAELRMGATFYPYQWLTVGAFTNYRHYSLEDANILEYGINAEIPFEKFSVAMSYEYGASDAVTSEGPEVTEKRWEIDIKKTF